MTWRPLLVIVLELFLLVAGIGVIASIVKADYSKVKRDSAGKDLASLTLIVLLLLVLLTGCQQVAKIYCGTYAEYEWVRHVPTDKVVQLRLVNGGWVLFFPDGGDRSPFLWPPANCTDLAPL